MAPGGGKRSGLEEWEGDRIAISEVAADWYGVERRSRHFQIVNIQPVST